MKSKKTIGQYGTESSVLLRIPGEVQRAKKNCRYSIHQQGLLSSLSKAQAHPCSRGNYLVFRGKAKPVVLRFIRRRFVTILQPHNRTDMALEASAMGRKGMLLDRAPPMVAGLVLALVGRPGGLGFGIITPATLTLIRLAPQLRERGEREEFMGTYHDNM